MRHSGIASGTLCLHIHRLDHRLTSTTKSHALAVIQRTITREKAAIEAETLKAPVADVEMVVEDSATDITEPASEDATSGVLGTATARRSSAIALSSKKASRASLIPLKLDLSSAALSGIPMELVPSPVTLAPRTTRPRADTLSTPITGMGPSIPELLSALAAQNDAFGPPAPPPANIIDLTLDNSSDDGMQKTAPIDLTMFMDSEPDPVNDPSTTLIGQEVQQLLAATSTRDLGADSGDTLNLLNALSQNEGASPETASLLASLTDPSPHPLVADVADAAASASLLATFTGSTDRATLDAVTQKTGARDLGQATGLIDPMDILNSIPTPLPDQPTLDSVGLTGLDLDSDFFMMNGAGAIGALDGSMGMEMMDFLSSMGDVSASALPNSSAATGSPAK